MTTFAILTAISVGTQIGFWILALVNIFKHTDWSGGKKFLWVLIVLILGPLGTFLYLLVGQKKKWALIFLALVIVPLIFAFVSLKKSFNPSEKINIYDSTTGKTKEESISKTEQTKLIVGDKMTLTLIEVLNRELKKYYAENGVYPDAKNLMIGSGQAQTWVPTRGFVSFASESEKRYQYDLKHPYAGENEVFGNIIYTTENNNQSYRITFTLVTDGTQYSPGSHFYTPVGIDLEDYNLESNQNIINEQSNLPSEDSDNDGLTNDDEINIWHTDPNNSDTDGDGYLDGEEVKNGYDPLIAGNAKLK